MPITVGPVHIEIFPERLLQRGGPIDLATEAKARQVHDLAKEFIGTTYSGQHPDQPRMKDTGEVLPGEGGSISWRVVFRHKFALGHHEGVPGHEIRVGKKGVLANRYTGFFSRHDVWHKGTTGNPYLVKGAQAAGLSTTGGGGLQVGRLRGTSGQFIPFPSSI